MCGIVCCLCRIPKRNPLGYGAAIPFLPMVGCPKALDFVSPWRDCNSADLLAMPLDGLPETCRSEVLLPGSSQEE